MSAGAPACTPCHICLEVLGESQPQHLHFCPSPWQTKPFRHPLGMCSLPGMALQRCCSCFLARLLSHLLLPPLVWDPFCSYSHAGLLTDAWLTGHHLLLCLDASSNRIREEEKGTSLHGGESRLGWKHRAWGSEPPHSRDLPLCPGDVDGAVELLGAGTKADEKPVQNI